MNIAPILLILTSILLWRIGGFRVRLIRSGFLTYLVWLILDRLLGFSILPNNARLDDLIILMPNVAIGFYYSVHTVFVGLIFEAFWLIDKNAFGVLFVNLKQRRRQVTQDDLEKANIQKALVQLERQEFMRPFEPEQEHKNQLCLKFGEAADLQTGISSRASFYIPERGVYTNTICFGSIGSAKTAGFLYPILNQLLSYSPDDPSKRIGGLVFDAKDDFSEQVRKYCQQYNREDDFIHLVVDGEYICNPINDPDMSSQVVASLITSLSAQVLGESKEAFWKGQYMVLTDNVTNGLKVAFDYCNLLYVQPVVTNLEVGEKLTNYIRFICGQDNQNEGSVFVYRNILTNTDSPWVEYQNDEGTDRRFLPLRGRIGLRQENAVCRFDEFEAHLNDRPLDELQTHLTYLIACAIQDQLHNSLAHAPEGNTIKETIDELESLKTNLGIGERDITENSKTSFRLFKRCLLNPNAPDKAALFETALSLLKIDFEQVSFENPMQGTINPFSHDYYGALPEIIYFDKLPMTPIVRYIIDELRLHHLIVDNDRLLQAETFINWYQDSWVLGKDDELKGKIYGGLEAIINFFTNPKIMRTFAPSLVSYYDTLLNPKKNHKKLFPSFDYLMSEGQWLCVGIPKATYHRATDIICTLLKQQFQCVALQRTSPRKRAKYPDYNFDRMICLMIDEYHIFATVGDTQDADNNFLSLNRQPKVFGIFATQTIENLKGKFKSPEYTSQLLGCCRNKVFLGVEDIETAEYASKMVGEGLVYRVSKSLGENQSNTPYSVFAGGYASEEAGVNQSLSFNQQVDRILRPKAFLELRSFSGIAVCYDGDQRFIVRLYLKPYWRNMEEAFHWQVANGVLSKTKKL